MCGVAACVEGAEVAGAPRAPPAGARAGCAPGAPAPSPGALLAGLRARGPDRGGLAERRAAGGRVAVHLAGALLQTRGGAPLEACPLEDPGGDVLAFAGEVFGGLPGLRRGESDSQALFAALRLAGASGAATDAGSVPGVLSRLRGPWTVVFWQERQRTLWFGRDFMGRRTLLAHYPDADDPRFLLTSTVPQEPVEQEGGLAGEADRTRGGGVHPGSWGFWREVPTGLHRLQFDCRGGAVLSGVGWTDPLLLQLEAQERTPPTLPTGTPGATIACRDAFDEPAEAERAFEVAAELLEGALQRAVESRVRETDFNPDCAAGTASSESPTRPAHVLVAFSGGLDSMVLALLVHRALPLGEPVDLTTVCFRGGDSPDRASARKGAAELAAAAPGRLWRLIEVDVTLDMVEEARPRVLGLMCPANTYMDFNIGAALWFAASARGRCVFHRSAGDGGGDDYGVPEPESNFQSRARVVLMGHGADEQLGGYGRHRTCFARGGWEGLREELRLDVRRLWKRNLGRDDRFVGDWAREARLPFLDEGVMQTLLGLPVPVLCDPTQEKGRGDKRVLRRVAERLGLPDAARREKRAIQFGTRIAQLSNSRFFGSNRQANLAQAGSTVIPGLEHAA